MCAWRATSRRFRQPSPLPVPARRRRRRLADRPTSRMIRRDGRSAWVVMAAARRVLRKFCSSIKITALATTNAWYATSLPSWPNLLQLKCLSPHPRCRLADRRGFRRVTSVAPGAWRATRKGYSARPNSRRATRIAPTIRASSVIRDRRDSCQLIQTAKGAILLSEGTCDGHAKSPSVVPVSGASLWNADPAARQ